MPLSSQLQNAADTVLDDVLTQLSSVQESYKTEVVITESGSYIRNQYWQGIRVVDEIPSDGEELSVDLTKKPTDQDEDWSDAGMTLASAIPVGIEVHTYDSPAGKGYTIIGRVKESGISYIKVVNVGAEDYRNCDWTEEAQE